MPTKSTLTIYHNPRCSKSRAALTIVQQFANANDVPLNVVDYLMTPLNREQLQTLQKQLGAQRHEMVREHVDLSDAEQCQLLLVQPELLQRPIISYKNRAVIGRPTELIYDLLR